MKKEECIPGTRVYWFDDASCTGVLADPAIGTPVGTGEIACVIWDDKPENGPCRQTMELVCVFDEFQAWVNQVRRERGVENADNNAD